MDQPAATPRETRPATPRCPRTAAGLLVAGLVAVAAAAAGGGCAALGVGEGEVVEGPAFPDAAEQAGVLDIHVLRDGTTITFTNTTARAFGPARVWVNRWYGLAIDGLAVGQTVTLELSTFTDRYGQAFRAGGFFATEAAEPVVQVQVQEEAGPLLGLVVVGGRF
jgi:hypothetical protein